MCVANPLLLVDLDVANELSYPQPPASPQQGLAAVSGTPGAELAGSRLPDYGLCAYDAGLTRTLDEALERTALLVDRFQLKPAAWYEPAPLPQDPPVAVRPGLSYHPTTGGGGVVRVGQAGLAGNFRLASETWAVLPRRYRRGFTVEMALHVGTGLLQSLREATQPGTFFYWGTRAANKFWQVSQVSDPPYYVHTGVPLEEVNPDDPLDGLQLHALSLLLLPTGAIAVRWLDESANLQQVQTQPGAVTTGWQHVVLSWCPAQLYPEDPDIIDCWPFRRGTLRLVVNGKQVLVQEGVPELRHRDLAGPAFQQYTVPYYLSWGAGTPGWTHAYVPADAQGTPTPFEYEPTVLEEAFGGLLSGVDLRRLRVYEGAVTPLQARQLSTQYTPALKWGQLDVLL